MAIVRVVVVCSSVSRPKILNELQFLQLAVNCRCFCRSFAETEIKTSIASRNQVYFDVRLEQIRPTRKFTFHSTFVMYSARNRIRNEFPASPEPFLIGISVLIFAYIFSILRRWKLSR